MTTKGFKQKQQEILVVSALDLLSLNHTIGKEPDISDHKNVEELESASSRPAILNLRFPFELKPDQVKAVEAWLTNQYKGSIIYVRGTGKKEIACEWAREAVSMKYTERFIVLRLGPRRVLIEKNYRPV